MKDDRVTSLRRLAQAMPVALLLLISAGHAGPATVSFRFNDEVFAPELEEHITVAINGSVVHTVALGPQQDRESVILTVPAAASYRYDLCGAAKYRNPDGGTRIVRIDYAGTLTHLDGRSMGLFSGDDIVFFLRDMDADTDAGSEIVAKGACPQAVAMAEETRR